MPTVQELLASVDAARDEIVRLHQELVRIPTVNYGSRPDTGNETPACELIRDKLKAEGIGSDIYESAPTRGNHRICVTEVDLLDHHDLAENACLTRKRQVLIEHGQERGGLLGVPVCVHRGFLD